ncbi:Asp/Glu racemase [Haliea sp. E17]|uniref:maleate cis-trans isomerase family protein n=1 Tax=Haliea sp. E17 TaxID=3401576 RepID=UPI003AADC818
MKNIEGSIDRMKTRERSQYSDGYLDNYVGHRARIGVILPSTNTSVEYDCQRIVPRGVSWHFGRFLIEHVDFRDDANFLHFLDLMRQTIGASIESILTCRPDHVMLGMSAETFWGGIKGNDGFVDRIQQLLGEGTGLTTGANAAQRALEVLGVAGNSGKTISVITPYQPVGDRNVRLFFEDAGYRVKHVLGLRCANAHDAIALLPEQRIMEAVREVDGDDVDAIVQVGTNLSTLGIFPTLEKWLAKPLLPINVATCWHALRSCGIRDQFDHLGRLFEQH